MKKLLQRAAARALRATRLDLWPVHVRGGVADGARWTLSPWSSYWRGTHEPRVQAAVLALGGGAITGWCCWDLGAHFGIYSVGLARRVGPTGQVAAFEPMPSNCARLRRHARMNALPWLKVYEAAVSDQPGTAQFLAYDEMNSTVSHLPYDENEGPREGLPAIAVRTVQLDELVARGELRPPQFVKVDVEGHGHRALAGMAATLRLHRPTFIIALHSPQETDGVLAALAPHGYDHAPIDPAGRPPWHGQDLLCTPRA